MLNFTIKVNEEKRVVSTNRSENRSSLASGRFGSWRRNHQCSSCGATSRSFHQSTHDDDSTHDRQRAGRMETECSRTRRKNSPINRSKAIFSTVSFRSNWRVTANRRISTLKVFFRRWRTMPNRWSFDASLKRSNCTPVPSKVSRFPIVTFLTLSRGNNVTDISLTLDGTTAFPKVYQPLCTMLSKKVLNPADITSVNGRSTVRLKMEKLLSL